MAFMSEDQSIGHSFLAVCFVWLYQTGISDTKKYSCSSELDKAIIDSKKVHHPENLE